MTTQRATLIGASTILMWATLALFTVLSGDIPPLQLTALSFSIATLIGLLYSWWSGGKRWREQWRVPKRVWLLGVYGLFGYHFLYFVALDNAPAVEANLLNYLWPLLIVLFAAFLPGERLRWFHIAGAGLGFVGAALLVTRSGSLQLEAQYALGYTAALGCALTWSSYSVLSRYFGAIPTQAVGGFCAATAVLAWLAHLLFESFVVPQGIEWLAVLMLGLGPVGGAFFTWDVGMKRGNIKLLGTLAYAAPLLSTLLLIALGLAPATWSVAAACVLIVCGALLSSGLLTRPWRPVAPLPLDPD